MAELETLDETTANCCSPEAQKSCCESEAKATPINEIKAQILDQIRDQNDAFSGMARLLHFPAGG